MFPTTFPLAFSGKNTVKPTQITVTKDNWDRVKALVEHPAMLGAGGFKAELQGAKFDFRSTNGGAYDLVVEGRGVGWHAYHFPQLSLTTDYVDHDKATPEKVEKANNWAEQFFRTVQKEHITHQYENWHLRPVTPIVNPIQNILPDADAFVRSSPTK